MQQLDIFADSEPIQRANDLIAALVHLDQAAAQQAMRGLTAADPHHEGLHKFHVLCNFLDHWTERFNEPYGADITANLVAEEQWISEQIIPATSVMGPAGDVLLRKVWGAMAKLSENSGIDAKHSDCFAAALYLRAYQFNHAVRTAKVLPGADMRAAVQRWLALGYAGSGEMEHARRAALRFAWLSPQEFDGFVGEMHDKELLRDWNKFQADLEDLDATWFPAWCANEKKADTPILDNLPVHDGCSAYRLVVSLGLRERTGISSAVLAERARLKQLNETFFAYYMRRRAYPAAMPVRRP